MRTCSNEDNHKNSVRTVLSVLFQDAISWQLCSALETVCWDGKGEAEGRL